MRPTFHQSRVCDLTVLERAPSLGEMEQLARQIVPRSGCPGSRLEVSDWPCEACRSSRSHSHTQNDQHAGDLAVPVHPPPRLLPAPLLLHLPEAIGSGSCRLELRPDRSPDHPAPWGLDWFFLSCLMAWVLACFWSLQQPQALSGYSDRLG